MTSTFSDDSTPIDIADAHKLIFQHFFPDEPVDNRVNYRPGAIFTKLCVDSGFASHGGAIRYDMPARLEHYSPIVKLLLSGETRARATYIDDESRSRGFSNVHAITKNDVAAIIAGIEASFAGKKADLPRKPVAKKFSTRRDHGPREFYPDEDNALKDAFCKGLGIDAASTSSHFVTLFNDIHDKASKDGGTPAINSPANRPLGVLAEEMLMANKGLQMPPRTKGRTPSGMAIETVSLRLHKKRNSQPMYEMTPELAEVCGKIIAQETPWVLKDYKKTTPSTGADASKENLLTKYKVGSKPSYLGKTDNKE